MSSQTPYWPQLVVGGLAFIAATVSSVAAWRAVRANKDASTAALDANRQTDARDEWWRRTQWAIDMAIDDNPQRSEIGNRALAELSRSPLADLTTDVPIITAVMEVLVEAAEPSPTNIELDPADG